MGGGGGYDIGASFSMASSSTSGVHADNRFFAGDFIVGQKKPNPVWLWPVVIGSAVLLAVLLIVRR